MADFERTKISTEAAESFTDAFYTALQTARGSLHTYYVPSTTDPVDGKTTPSILWNGNILTSGEAFQEMMSTTMPSYTHYDVQSLDCHVLNVSSGTTQGGFGQPAQPTARGGKKTPTVMSLTVAVSGSVRLEEPREGPIRGFSETFVLAPNLEKMEGKTRGKMAERRNWLIQTQNFRYVS